MLVYLARTPRIYSTALLFCLGLAAAPVHAQSSASDAAQANNPLANKTAFNLQNHYINELTCRGNSSANPCVLRHARPVTNGESNWLIRASLPDNSFPVGVDGSRESAIGDFDIFAAYQIDTGDPAVSSAIGPHVVAPTATDDRLGSDQWLLGIANVNFNAKSPSAQYGYLLTWRGGVGDTIGRPRTRLGVFEPFLIYQLGNGWYTGGAAIWTYNFKNDNYSVPLGIRPAKVFKRNYTVFNVFMEPQWPIHDKGNDLPKEQIYFAVNM